MNRILTLRRRLHETSEIHIDFFIRYTGSLSLNIGASGATTYLLGDGIQPGVSPKKISILYSEDVNNVSEITISDDEFRHVLTISDPDIHSIVIEESDEDFIVIEESDEDFIVIEESDEDFNTNQKVIRIKIPTSNEDFNVKSNLNRANIPVVSR